jgi:NCAIR mutase (PurE)-related protein
MADSIHSQSISQCIADLGEVQLDLGRRERCGFPEVIYGEGKTKETILKIFRSLTEYGLDGFATRIDAEKGQFLEQELSTGGSLFRYNPVARTFRLLASAAPPSIVCGKIAVISAGTSDAPVAEEARETALWTGAEVVFIQDVGVAGPHRLQAKLPEFQDADAIVVVAGMEGALPSVVGGFVSCPVIAVPTSVGYGASFGGLAALLGMLNSCASNVTVVNIDAGFKAGYVAGLIAKRKTKI